MGDKGDEEMDKSIKSPVKQDDKLNGNENSIDEIDGDFDMHKKDDKSSRDLEKEPEKLPKVVKTPKPEKVKHKVEEISTSNSINHKKPTFLSKLKDSDDT